MEIVKIFSETCACCEKENQISDKYKDDMICIDCEDEFTSFKMSGTEQWVKDMLSLRV